MYFIEDQAEPLNADGRLLRLSATKRRQRRITGAREVILLIGERLSVANEIERHDDSPVMVRRPAGRTQREDVHRWRDAQVVPSGE
ncbi:hypothetical protein V8J79_06475 [Burkholderia pyrrocinia]|nr:hypothetical protein [Burkholderia metallica]